MMVCMDNVRSMLQTAFSPVSRQVSLFDIDVCQFLMFILSLLVFAFVFKTHLIEESDSLNVFMKIY